MPFFPALIGGSVGGLIGAVVWAGISYLTNCEIGWIALGIGFLVGSGVRVGAKEWEGSLPGALAVLIALASIVGGKYAAASIMDPIPINLYPTAEDVKKGMARSVVEEFQAKGAKLNWPMGNEPNQIEASVRLGIFPEVIDQEVEKRWNDLGVAKQQEMIQNEKEDREEFLRILRSAARASFLANSFRLMDLVMFILAGITAFRIGSGTSFGTD